MSRDHSKGSGIVASRVDFWRPWPMAKAGYRLWIVFLVIWCSRSSALAEQFDLAHASHAISTEIATSLFAPCLKGLEDVLVGLNGNVVVLVQVFELDHVVLTGRRPAGAAIPSSQREVGGTLELRVDAVLQSLIGDVQRNH